MAAFAAIFCLAAIVSAFLLPPIAYLTATPNPAGVTSTITAVASDLSHSGIGMLKIYEDGREVKSCLTSVCVYSAVHTSAGTRVYQAVATDNAGGVGSSNAVSIYFTGDISPPANHAPILAPIGDKVVLVGDLLEFTISATDPDGDSLTFSATGVPAGASFNPSTRTFTWTPVISDLGDHLVTFSVSDGFLSDSETITISVVDALDDEAPKYWNITENPANGSDYAPGQVYEFNITWTDNIAVTAVWAEFDGDSVSVTNDGNIYSFSVSDLGAGEYVYVWHARDGSGNTNTTGNITYVVNKAMPALDITMSPSSIVSSGTETTVNGTGCPSQLVCELFREGTNVSNPDIASLADGTYTYLFNTTGNENYTAASVSENLRVGISGGGGGTGTNETKIITITDSQLTAGHYVYMRIGDKLKFQYCGAPYYIKLTDIDEDDDDDERAFFKITPRGSVFSLEEDDREELDVDYDNNADILFKVDRISSERVKVYIKRISDICAGMGPKLNMTEFDWHGVEIINGQEEKGKGMLYAILFLLLGILLAALAIMITLFGKKRRKRV